MMPKKPVTFSVPDYARAIIPGIKDKIVTPQAVIKQINVTTLKTALAAGKKKKSKDGTRTLKIRAAGLPKGVKAERYGRFYTITVMVENPTLITY